MAKKLLYAWLLLCMSPAMAQDHIITWDNDTLRGRFATNPKKEGFRPAHKYNNAFFESVFYFTEDSLRVIKPGDVKSYYRHSHGKRVLCEGNFESWQITSSELHYSRYDNRDSARHWYFVRKVLDGEHADLYTLIDDCGRGYFTDYLIHKKGTGVLRGFESKRKAIAYLSDPSIKDEFSKFKYRGSKIGYRDVVKEYNRLKDAGQ